MKNQTALITGASRGIGRAIAARLSAAGYDLVITCREREDLLKQAADEFSSHGIHCRTFIGDLGEQGTAARLFDEIGETGRTIDVLINNAGQSHIGLFQDTTWEEWQSILSSNLTSVYALCKEAIPGMLWNGHGKIINISSVWGVCGASCEVAYSATKGGINAMTRALAKELAPSSIQVNAIACGVIDTEMNACFSAEERAQLAEEIPAGRFGAPEEVASLAVQITTGNDYLTGQIITLDGGYL